MTVYLDHAATTPLRPEAAAAMQEWQGERFGNPSGSHSIARAAKDAVEEAREQIASALGVAPDEVILTSGGTEADNLAIAGVLAHRPGPVVTSAVEHHAVLHAAEAAARAHGTEHRVVPVDADGVVNLDALEAALDPSVSVVSVMLVNNEVGTIQPLSAVAERVRRVAPGARLHTDAVQALPWVDLAGLAGSADMISISAHKFGGPQGVGALAVRGDVTLEPLVYGGGQERGLRPGTHNVAGIRGMAAAATVTVSRRPAEVARLGALRDRLADTLLAEVPGTWETGPRSGRAAGHCHLRFEGVESEELLFLLDQAGVCASAGSACASGAIEPSHVLIAMGVSHAGGALRLTLGATTTPQDIEMMEKVLPDLLSRLRGG